MNRHDSFDAITRAARRALLPSLAAAALWLAAGAAAARDESGWSINFTPVLIFPKDEYRFGGGVDPEVKYTVDLGHARLSAGGRVASYYARNLFGVMVMPTVRLTVPVGPVEPYVAVGMGYGWLPKIEHEDFASMSRLGVVFRFSDSFALSFEGTVQRIENSDFRFPSFGSMVSLDL